ncbi:secretin N-terminal domain-containing protein [Ideonella margarita]|uniref:Secretin N-terminal domain-containing protein n=1 Tax=Ideonella margarita TaxID=2984191 RepID=A0ABU9C842_9BURK
MTPTQILARGGLLSSLLSLGACAPINTAVPGQLPLKTPVQTVLELQPDSLVKPAPATRVEARVEPVATAANAAAAPTPRAEPPAEPRFDLIVNSAPARDVFLALASDGRYNVLVHPDLAGQISVTLRRVTMREAMEALRDVYGYDFKVEGRRITVFPPTMQSRVFVVNYLHSQRSGRSDVRVSSGAAPANNSNGTNGGNSSGSNGGNGAGGTSQSQPDSSQITTQSRNDLWAELGESVRAMIGTAGGRSVIVSPQSGLLAVRAMPDELRQVEAMLSAARMAVERQVMLDVKIVQVELREGFQSGIDWSILRGRGAAGSLNGNATNPLLSNGNGLPTLTSGLSTAADALSGPLGGNGLFGLSLAGNGFQAVMGFLETHGEVQTLSSPRLATLNNQKAVLKVGIDDYFVTNVSGGTTGTGNTTSTTGNTTTMPTLTLTPFFSGIALDVTPQIDEGHMITLHVHPSVSSVTERNKQVDLGTMGAYKLPLASSSINETDTIVRIPDGQIVAIGGLMQTETVRQTSGLPGSGANAVTASVLGNRANTGKKKELVVLIKPSIIRSSEDWQAQTQAAWASLADTDTPVRVIRVDGHGSSQSTGKPMSGPAAAPAMAPAIAPATSPAASPATSPKAGTKVELQTPPATATTETSTQLAAAAPGVGGAPWPVGTTGGRPQIRLYRLRAGAYGADLPDAASNSDATTAASAGKVRRSAAPRAFAEHAPARQTGARQVASIHPR